MIKAGIIGATGYAGAELVRLLTVHPHAEIAAVSSVTFEGKALSSVYPAYRGLNDMVCEKADDVVKKKRRCICRAAARAFAGACKAVL